MSTDELIWAMLPDGLQDYFELQNYRKTDNEFEIILVEKNFVPENLPKEYLGRKITDNSLNTFVLDDFPIRGRRTKIILKRRSWKFEGIDKWFKRDLKLCAQGTKLEKEFAVFLKEPD